MDSIILILIAACIFVPCIIYLRRRKKIRRTKNTRTRRDNIKHLHRVEAGPTKHFFSKKVDLMPTVAVDMEGIKINPELEYFVVKNQCMQIKGISDGDIIGVRMFKDGFEMPTTSKEGLILLIYLDDDHFKGYKIREQGELTNDGMAYNTYHYKGGVQNRSSRPHAIESIKGIVTEVYQRQFVTSM